MALHFTKQTKEIQERLLVLFRALEEGANLSMPVARHMSGHPGLMELRVRDARGIVRVFYCVQMRGHVFVLHLFRKKTQKTPQQEIDTALSRLRRMKEEFNG